jgi:hypothetical protein
MPKIAEYPRLRTHTRKGVKGQEWVTYFWDGRAFGIKDVPLGSDRAEALAKWARCESQMAREAKTEALTLAGLMLLAVDPLPLPGGSDWRQ